MCKVPTLGKLSYNKAQYLLYEPPQVKIVPHSVTQTLTVIAESLQFTGPS